MQPATLRGRISLAGLLCGALLLSRQTRTSGEEPLSDPAAHFSVKLVDESGKPVEGADLGLLACAGDRIREYAAKDKTEWFYNEHARSDAEGIAHFRHGTEVLNRVSIVARHERGKIAAVLAIDPSDVDKTKPIGLVLKPETDIAGRATCKQLADLGRELSWIVVYVRTGGKVVLECGFKQPTFRVALPPGEYEIETYSGDCDSARKTIAVTAQAEPQEIELDMPATKLALLEGHPAPELVDVVAWKNSKPLTLADLRGKCVLLDFWGHWCGPCVHQMPKLFKLHDKYADQGLVVIGIHVDIQTEPRYVVDTVAKLNEKLVDTRKQLWEDRDVPFPVAMVTTKAGTDLGDAPSRVENATVASYGIHMYPTGVLIDRRGNVVGMFYPNDEGIKLLEKALKED